MHAFREYFSEYYDFQHPPARHHDVIIDGLEALERGDIRRCIIQAPPGSAKSTYGSIQFPLYFLARNPQARILAASNTIDLAETFNRQRRSIVQSPEWQALTETTLSKDEQGVAQWATSAGGRVRAAGVGSAIMGYRSNLNCLDDPIASFEEAMSDTQLEKMWQWFKADYRSRLVPDGRELIIMTRYSVKDPIGKLQDLIEEGREEWHIIRLPMLCDDPENDPLHRKKDAPLWPEWFGQHQIEQNQDDTLRWMGMYQQTPLDERGSWVSMEDIKIRKQAPGNLRIVIMGDLALSVGKGDWTVFGVFGVDEDRNAWLIDLYRERVSPEESADQLLRMCREFNPDFVDLDDDNASKVWMRLLVEKARAASIPVPVGLIPLRGRDKETRAAPIRGFFKSGRIHILERPWTSIVVKEVLSFPGAAVNDDIIDVLSLFGRRLVDLAPPKREEMEQTPDMTGLLKMDEGRVVLTKTLDDLWESNKPRRSERI